MGLDAIEIVMEAEERFNVSLQDSDWTHVRTVADLAALVLAKMTVSGDVCPSQRAFHELRRALGRVGVGRERIRPRSAIDELLPGLSGKTWKRLCAADRRLTAFAMCDREDSSAVLLLVAIMTGGLLLTPLIGGCLAVLTAAVAAGIGAILHHSVTNLRRIRLQPAYSTVGDIARALAPAAPAASTGERLAREGEVLDEVRRITAGCLGLPLERVLPRSDFVRDLGMD